MWKSILWFFVGYLNLIVGLTATFCVFLSAEYPWHGQWTAFHIAAIPVILFVTSLSSVRIWGWFPLILCVFCLSGCGTVTTRSTSRVFRARVTFYHSHEDKYGARTASGCRANEGRTIAAAKWATFGERVRIPQLRGLVGDGNFVVEDRGRDVERKKASRGLLPVVDVYVASRLKYRHCRDYCPPVMDVLIP